MFLLPQINLKLRPKILDMPPGTRVASNTFTMEDWEADETLVVGGECTTWCTALFWIVPAKVEGTWKMPQGELTLKQQFQMLTGTLGSNPISNARMRGSDITFTAGGTQYTGRVNGSTIQGTGGGSWTASEDQVAWHGTQRPRRREDTKQVQSAEHANLFFFIVASGGRPSRPLVRRKRVATTNDRDWLLVCRCDVLSSHRPRRGPLAELVLRAAGVLSFSCFRTVVPIKAALARALRPLRVPR